MQLAVQYAPTFFNCFPIAEGETMRKTLAIASTAFFLSACAADGSLLGGNADTDSAAGVSNALLNTWLDNQCRVELNNRNEWRIVALAMTAEKQREWEDKICGCVTQEAPNQLTATDLLQLGTQSGRTQVIAGVTAKTVTACTKRLFSK